MIQIFTDTSANLPASYIQKYALRVIPLTYLIDGVEAHQDPTVDFDGKAYYDAMRSGTSVTTAMINIAGFLEPLREALAAGDDAIYIGMSGGISGTAHAASLAVEELKEEFPERKVASIDTYAASLGEVLLVVEAARMLENGASFDEIVEKISQRRHVMCQYFTVDDLAYLERGGRVSKTAAAFGTALKIKPLLRGDEEGKIVLCGKTRGRKQSLTSLADFYEKLVTNKTEEIGIAHADDAQSAQFLLDELRKRGFTGDCLTVEQVTELMKLEPCGEGNRKPVFLLRNCTVQSKRALKEGKFTSMELRTGGAVLKAISFAMPFAKCFADIGSSVDVLATVELNEFRGNTSAELRIIEMRPAGFREDRFFAALRTYEEISRGEGCDKRLAPRVIPDRPALMSVYDLIRAHGGSMSAEEMCVYGDLNYCMLRIALDAFSEAGMAQVSADGGSVTLIPVNTKTDLMATGVISRLRQSLTA